MRMVIWLMRLCSPKISLHHLKLRVSIRAHDSGTECIGLIETLDSRDRFIDMQIQTWHCLAPSKTRQRDEMPNRQEVLINRIVRYSHDMAPDSDASPFL